MQDLLTEDALAGVVGRTYRRCPPCGDTGQIIDETTGRAWPCRCASHPHA